jgi:hypothetical protein
MKAFERRLFLTRGSMAVAAAGVVASSPGLVSGLITAEDEAPEAASVMSEATVAGESAVMTDPLVAHVRDLATGEIGVFSGMQEVVFHDPTLAARLFDATRR